MSHQTLLIIFTVCFLLEFAAFGMQRTTLLISREANLPPQIGAMLLPSWFPIVWMVRICKWSVLIFVAFFWSWGVAFTLLLVNIILATFLPISHSSYIPFFRKRITQLKKLDLAFGTELEEMLNNSKMHGENSDSSSSSLPHF